jgi:hypothetical protein
MPDDDQRSDSDSGFEIISNIHMDASKGFHVAF